MSYKNDLIIGNQEMECNKLSIRSNKILLSYQQENETLEIK